MSEIQRDMERETRLELATPTLARWLAKPSKPLRGKEYSILDGLCKGAAAACSAVLWLWFVLVALAWVIGLTGLWLFAPAAHAEPSVVFDSVVRSQAGWRISARGVANERPVTVCEKTLYDVLAGERIRIEGWGQVDALTTGIGVNMQIAYCDDTRPECNYSGRWDSPSVHKWGAGNVYRQGEHHKVFNPQADYLSGHYQPAVTFKLFVNVYSSQPAGAYAGLDDCAITFERHRD